MKKTKVGGAPGLGEIRDISLKGVSAAKLLSQLSSSGFQASALADAAGLIAEMKKRKSTIFLAFTANMVASGLRGVIAELCRKKFIDAVVTTAGSIDHDVIKSFAPYYRGSFAADDVELHRRGINRLGDIFIPTKRYELFEKLVQKWLGEIYAKRKCISPSALCFEIGKRVGKEKNSDAKNSFLHYCAKNSIPVFCPGITDGAIGLQAYFFKLQHPDFSIDVTGDMKNLAQIVLDAGSTAGIILGGGISKHHVIGANILRDGLDYAVYITTAQEFDGSLSGAFPREAKSWGKIRERGRSVSVNGDATVIFPLIAAALAEKGIL